MRVCVHASVCACLFFVCRWVCLHKCIHTLKRVHAYDAPVRIFFRGTQTVKYDFQLLVGGPTPNKVLFKELVAPPPPMGTLV